MVCHSLLQWTTFCQTSPPWPDRLGWPHMAWLSFIELDKAVVHVIRLASCLWLWFQSVCPLMPSLSAYHLTWVRLPWRWSISSWLLQQIAAAAPYLGHGLASLRHCPWPWTWGSSSWPAMLPRHCSCRATYHVNYGRMLVALYRKQESRPSSRKRNTKKQNGCVRRPYK